MKTEVLIIGGGHAGIEAANSAANCGVSVMLVTGNIDFIGQMSCNPAIGGIAKGNIVKEIDALGGLMGKIIDRTGIQFRMLNKSKGPAVWGPRAQADKVLYRNYSQKLLENNKNITFFQDMVVGIDVKNGIIKGAMTEAGIYIEAKTIILAMGTFLNGLAHIGMNSFSCGRIGETASFKLSESIQKNKIKSGRLKTGTPARIDKRSVDFTKMLEQRGDNDPWPFSFSTTDKIKNTAICWEIKTQEKTHDIIRKNLDKSPLYGGKIKSIGPRYCPSIEDKVVRFGNRNGHTLFLEPEGLNNNELYLNGFSTSLPFNIQIEMLQSLNGLESAKIIRPAYAIEYDYFLPTQLYSTLESRIIKNLYFAGQINGTSGYEEAACQGLVAGVNAAKNIKKEESFVLGRETSYTGVLIDDLVTKGTEEPYRMFTSRAEYRLLLRQDNADERLMPLAYNGGFLDREYYKKRKNIWKKRKEAKETLSQFDVTPKNWKYVKKTEVKQKTKAVDLIKRPEVSVDDFCDMIEIKNLDVFQKVTLEADIKYSGFIDKQKKQIEKLKNIEKTKIPKKIDYLLIEGLLTESRDKLIKIKPLTLGQASRIPGVTPADISVLIMYLMRNS